MTLTCRDGKVIIRLKQNWNLCQLWFKINQFSGYGAILLPPPRESGVTQSWSPDTQDLSVIIVITRPGAETTWSSTWRLSVSPGDNRTFRQLRWPRPSLFIRDRDLPRGNSWQAKWSRRGGQHSRSDPEPPPCPPSHPQTAQDHRHPPAHRACLAITTQRCSGISIGGSQMTIWWQTWSGDPNSGDSFPEIRSTPRHLTYSQQISCNSFFVDKKYRTRKSVGNNPFLHFSSL